MSNIDLISSFSEFKELKNIDRPTMMKVLEDVFRSMLKRKYESDEGFDIIINTETGDLEIYRTREVVANGTLENPYTQIEEKDAVLIDPDFTAGEECIEEVTLEMFGRRAILSARQTLQGRIMDLEKDELYKKYKDRVGEIVTGEVYQIWKREILVLDDDGNELIMPKTEQIPADFFKKGDTVRAVVKEVDMHNNTPRIIISRTDPAFLERLFEMEVPEVFDGLITIKKIVRVPGERAKVAVESYDDRIDPVGACVGMKGSRIHGIVRELRNENIDVINFTNNTILFIQRALNPAKITKIELDEENKTANVHMKPDQVSLAIGKGGYNIKLAGRLTGYEIDVYREEDANFEEDVDLNEFSDEIEAWILDELKAIGCETAKSVLRYTARELEEKTSIGAEDVQKVLEVLRSEFE